MKNFSLLIIISMFIPALKAQLITDSISLDAGYTHQSYYSLLNGEVSHTGNQDWDLAFDVSAFGSSIHINGLAGTLLYTYPSGDTNAWTSIDTNFSTAWKRTR